MMNVAVAKTETGRALSDAFALARGPAAGRRQGRRSAPAGVRGLRARRPAAPADRGLEIHRPARADARGVAAGGCAGCGGAERGPSGARRGMRWPAPPGWCWSTASVRAELSDLAGLDAGVRVQTLREVLENGGNEARADLLNTDVSDDAMISLNAAMVTDGVLVTVADGAVASKPIQIVHVATRCAGGGLSRARSSGSARAPARPWSKVLSAPTAPRPIRSTMPSSSGSATRRELEHVRLMVDAPDAVNISTAVFTIGAHARLNTFNMTSGGAVSRYQGYITFAGEGAQRRHQRRQSAQRPPACRHHAVPRSCGAELRRAARSSARWSTTAAIRCFRAASSFARTRRRPTPR